MNDNYELLLQSLMDDSTLSNLESLQEYSQYSMHHLPKILIKLKDLIYDMEDYNIDYDPIIESYVTECRSMVFYGLRVMNDFTEFIPLNTHEEFWVYVDDVLVRDFLLGLGKESITGSSKGDLQLFFLRDFLFAIEELFCGYAHKVKKELLSELIINSKYKVLGLFGHLVDVVYHQIRNTFINELTSHISLTSLDTILDLYSRIIDVNIINILRVHVFYRCISDVWNNLKKTH